MRGGEAGRPRAGAGAPRLTQGACGHQNVLVAELIPYPSPPGAHVKGRRQPLLPAIFQINDRREAGVQLNIINKEIRRGRVVGKEPSSLLSEGRQSSPGEYRSEVELIVTLLTKNTLQ